MLLTEGDCFFSDPSFLFALLNSTTPAMNTAISSAMSRKDTATPDSTAVRSSAPPVGGSVKKDIGVNDAQKTLEKHVRYIH